MIATEMIYHIMKTEGVTSDELAERMNLSDRRRVNAVLNQDHIFVETFARYLAALGWRLCAVREKDGETLEVGCGSPESPLRYDFPLGLNDMTRKENKDND